MVKHNEANLPKWAQNELHSLRHRVARLLETVNDMSDGSGPVELRVVPEHHFDAGALRFPEHTDVRFHLSGGAYVDVAIRNDGLWLNSSGPCRIAPEATNCFTVSAKRW